MLSSTVDFRRGIGSRNKHKTLGHIGEKAQKYVDPLVLETRVRNNKGTFVLIVRNITEKDGKL